MTFTVTVNNGSNVIQEKHSIQHSSMLQQNLSPDISWSNVSEETKSFIVTMEQKSCDNKETNIYNWCIANIDKNCLHLKEGAGLGNHHLSDNAIHVNNDYSMPIYLGPNLVHSLEATYEIVVWQMFNEIDLSRSVSVNQIVQYCQARAISSSSVILKYISPIIDGNDSSISAGNLDDTITDNDRKESFFSKLFG